MLTLYDNAFSPFARKVRLVLEHKQLAHEVIDGLRKSGRAALEAVNGRVEVPVLVHDGVTVANSSDIVAYLERVFPERPVYPRAAADWVHARAWERCSDSVVDPILIDVSYWTWAQRPDPMPEGLLSAARKDLSVIYDALDAELRGRDFICGELSIADIALFPHITSARSLDVSFDAERCPSLMAWLKRTRSMDVFARDLERTRHFIANVVSSDIEREKIFWRGDRIEWMLARGFHRWFVREIEEDRVLWPGLGIPQRR